jgi:hypothetical protein
MKHLGLHNNNKTRQVYVNIQFDIVAWKASLLGGKHQFLSSKISKKKYQTEVHT